MICECEAGNGFQMSFLPVTPFVQSESWWYTVLSGCLVPLSVVTCTAAHYALLMLITVTAAVPRQLIIWDIYIYCCLPVSELTHHPAYQPFQQRLFHLGGHVPQVFPTHRRKCPSSTFFKPRGSHPFSCSQVMAAVPEADCESAA